MVTQANKPLAQQYLDRVLNEEFPAAQEIEQSPVTLSIATCTLGKVRIEWATNMFRFRKLIGMKTQQKVMLNYELCDARNVAVHEALAENVEFLLFWDDDMLPFDSTATVKLLAEMQLHPEIDVIGGVYPPRRDITEPLVIKQRNMGTWWGWRDGRVHKVFMVGTGFMMLRMDSLRKMDVPTYTLGELELKQFFDDGADITDDFYFAYLAEQNGLNTYVHGGVICAQINIDGKMFTIPDTEVE